jgi:oligoendopeptidase F
MQIRTCALLFGFLGALPFSGSAVERGEVPEKYRWDLRVLYADEPAWIADKTALASELPKLEQWKGRLGESSASLNSAMGQWERASRMGDRLYAYALQVYDQDTRVGRSMQMKQEASQALSDLQTATAFMQPEILALGRPTIERYLAEQPALAPYRMFFDDILRAAPHTLSPAEERILAAAGPLAKAGGTVHSVFTAADLPFPEITLASGEKVRLDAAAYTRHRASPVRADREAVFKAFWTRYGEFGRTLAATLNAHVQSHDFFRRQRSFPSSLEAAQFPSNIPKGVYTQLLADVHENLPTLHRYLRLRQRIMGLDRLGYADLYAPIVADVDLQFSPERAQALTLEAFAPLGGEYVDVLRQGYEDRWMDLLPNEGKSPGAYSNSVYGVHPFQLLNFNGGYEDLSTLAHESGHSMHSYLASKHQPYATAGYSTFVAEVASTLNESLLFRHMLAGARDDATRLFLLSSYLDVMRTTLFRQTLFAEFELKIHEAVERGEPLTAESLSKTYLDLVRTYYGHDQGVCNVDETIGAEWAYIPHFYLNFYVYQYATSLIGGMSLSEGIIGERARKDGTAVRNRDAYLRLLSSGSSKYPIELLKDAGVDMTTSQPFEAAMREMNRIMDEMERIYDRAGSRARTSGAGATSAGR